jgi:RNA polymerase sigma-70 factor (ECF subfamily)
MVVAWRHGEAGALRVADTSQVFDREAEFERLVLPLRDRMMRTVWRVARDPELAEDAFQEALVTTWRKLPELASHANPTALVLRICLDAAVDQLRARQRRRRLTAPLERAGGAAAPDESPARQAEASEQTRLVLTALARLKGQQATALLLRAIHELPYATIAEVLRCSEPTARVHVSRAREKLRQWLSHLLPAAEGGR